MQNLKESLDNKKEQNKKSVEMIDYNIRKRPFSNKSLKKSFFVYDSANNINFKKKKMEIIAMNQIEKSLKYLYNHKNKNELYLTSRKKNKFINSKSNSTHNIYSNYK